MFAKLESYEFQYPSIHIIKKEPRFSVNSSVRLSVRHNPSVIIREGKNRSGNVNKTK